MTDDLLEGLGVSPHEGIAEDLPMVEPAEAKAAEEAAAAAKAAEEAAAEGDEGEGVFARLSKKFRKEGGEGDVTAEKIRKLELDGANLRGQLESALGRLDDRIKEGEGPAVGKEEPGVVVNPMLLDKLKEIGEKTPEHLGAAMTEVIGSILAEGRKELKTGLDTEVGKIRSEVQLSEAARVLKGRIDKNLDYVARINPAAKELVDEYRSCPEDEGRQSTRLGRYMLDNPGHLQSEYGLAAAIRGVAALAEDALSSQQETEPGVETSALGSKGSRRGQKLTKPAEEELDDEDRALDGIAATKAIKSGLEELLTPMSGRA